MDGVLETNEDDPAYPAGAGLDSWFMDQVMLRAVCLWRGGQADGSEWEWESDFDWSTITWFTDTKELLASRGAVMAGYRYVTSFKSTPRYLRAPMHEDLL